MAEKISKLIDNLEFCKPAGWSWSSFTLLIAASPASAIAVLSNLAAEKITFPTQVGFLDLESKFKANQKIQNAQAAIEQKIITIKNLAMQIEAQPNISPKNLTIRKSNPIHVEYQNPNRLQGQLYAQRDQLQPLLTNLQNVISSELPNSRDRTNYIEFLNIAKTNIRTMESIDLVKYFNDKVSLTTSRGTASVSQQSSQHGKGRSNLRLIPNKKTELINATMIALGTLVSYNPNNPSLQGVMLESLGNEGNSTAVAIQEVRSQIYQPILTAIDNLVPKTPQNKDQKVGLPMTNDPKFGSNAQQLVIIGMDNYSQYIQSNPNNSYVPNDMPISITGKERTKKPIILAQPTGIENSPTIENLSPKVAEKFFENPYEVMTIIKNNQGVTPRISLDRLGNGVFIKNWKKLAEVVDYNFSKNPEKIGINSNIAQHLNMKAATQMGNSLYIPIQLGRQSEVKDILVSQSKLDFNNWTSRQTTQKQTFIPKDRITIENVRIGTTQNYETKLTIVGQSNIDLQKLKNYLLAETKDDFSLEFDKSTGNIIFTLINTEGTKNLISSIKNIGLPFTPLPTITSNLDTLDPSIVIPSYSDKNGSWTTNPVLINSIPTVNRQSIQDKLDYIKKTEPNVKPFAVEVLIGGGDNILPQFDNTFARIYIKGDNNTNNNISATQELGHIKVTTNLSSNQKAFVVYTPMQSEGETTVPSELIGSELADQTVDNTQEQIDFENKKIEHLPESIKAKISNWKSRVENITSEDQDKEIPTEIQLKKVVEEIRQYVDTNNIYGKSSSINNSLKKTNGTVDQMLILLTNNMESPRKEPISCETANFILQSILNIVGFEAYQYSGYLDGNDDGQFTADEAHAWVKASVRSDTGKTPLFIVDATPSRKVQIQELESNPIIATLTLIGGGGLLAIKLKRKKKKESVIFNQPSKITKPYQSQLTTSNKPKTMKLSKIPETIIKATKARVEEWQNRDIESTSFNDDQINLLYSYTLWTQYGGESKFNVESDSNARNQSRQKKLTLIKAKSNLVHKELTNLESNLYKKLIELGLESNQNIQKDIETLRSIGIRVIKKN